MANWYKINLDNDESRNRTQIELQMAFARIFQAHHGPKDAAMFGDRSATKNNLYFTETAYRIAESLLADYGVTACDAPDGSELSLLVGASVWSDFLQ